MNRFIALCLVCLAACSTTSSDRQWHAAGQALSQSSFRKSSGSFGGMLLLTTNPAEFVSEWENKRVEEDPHIQTAYEIHQGDTIAAFVVFGGCQADGRGLCNSSLDYVVIRPDGDLYAKKEGLMLWNDAPAPSPLIQLAPASLGIRIEPQDPLGEYIVRATIRDLVAAKTLILEQRFTVK
jgi:hypothetical protein